VNALRHALDAVETEFSGRDAADSSSTGTSIVDATRTIVRLLWNKDNNESGAASEGGGNGSSTTSNLLLPLLEQFCATDTESWEVRTEARLFILRLLCRLHIATPEQANAMRCFSIFALQQRTSSSDVTLCETLVNDPLVLAQEVRVCAVALFVPVSSLSLSMCSSPPSHLLFPLYSLDVQRKLK
jgi:hypothetical protein